MHDADAMWVVDLWDLGTGKFEQIILKVVRLTTVNYGGHSRVDKSWPVDFISDRLFVINCSDFVEIDDAAGTLTIALIVLA